MWMMNRMARLRWLALIALVGLLLVSTGASSSYAQSTGSPQKSAGSLDGDLGTNQGDPDGPTGDVPPPSATSSTSSRTGGSATGSHVATGEITAVAPGRHAGLWASWKLALKMLARNFPYYVR